MTLVDKFAHLGGTLGLFNGFTIIFLFEFFAFGIAVLFQLYNNWKNKGNQPNDLKIEEKKTTEKIDSTEKKINFMTQKLEAIQNEIDVLKTALKENVDTHVAKEEITYIIENKKKQESLKNKRITII